MATPFVYDRVKETSTSTGIGTFTLSGAVTGYRTFLSAVGDTNTTFYCIENATLGEWEIGLGTVNSNTISRTSVIKSSNNNALVSFSAGTKYVFCTVPGQQHALVDPGIAEGRLTLSSGLPVPMLDVTGATTVYYSPYVGNKIATHVSNERWILTQFSEVSLNLGAVSGSLPYDIFGYDSSGTLVLEKLAWASTVARGTSLALLDGVWTNGGNTTRRYLGTIHISGNTSATEDSSQRRLVWNVQNQVPRRLHICPGYTDTAANTSYTTTSNTYVEANASSGSRAEFVLGLTQHSEAYANFVVVTGASGAYGAIGVDNSAPLATSARAGSQSNTAGVLATFSCRTGSMFPLGYHYYSLLIATQSSATSTFFVDGSRSAVGSSNDVKNTYLEGTVWG